MTAMFITEGTLMSLRFTAPRVIQPAWWMLPLTTAHRLLVPGFLAIGMMAILVGTGDRSATDGERTSAGRRPGRLMGLLTHLTALLVLVVMTVQVCDRPVLATRWPAAWIWGWCAAGVAVMVTWLAALNPDAWYTLSARRALGVGLAGVSAALSGVGLTLVGGKLWMGMAGATFTLVWLGLASVCSQVVYNPVNYEIGTTAFSVRIAPSCSGYEGIGLVWAFLAMYLIGSRRSLRWPHAWLLIPLGTVAIWLANAARIVALVLIGSWGSPEIALGGFHSHAGNLGFLVISLGLVLISRQSAVFMVEPRSLLTAPRATSDEVVTVNPTAVYLVPFLAVLATTMATGAVSKAGFDPLYPLRIMAGAIALGYFARSFPGHWFDRSGLAVLIGVLVFGLWVALEPANPAGATTLRRGLTEMTPAGAALWIAFRAVGSVLVVPLVEEWAFRGYLTRRLIATDFESVPPGRFTLASFLISSLAFGLLHGRWFAGTLAGLSYAGVYYRRGRVGDAALAHAVTNACIAATVLSTGDWSYWT